MMEQQSLEPIEQEPVHGYPVDVTEEEFVQFSLTMAKTFGALRLQKPTAVCFVLYLLIAIGLVVWEYIDTGTISWVLLSVAALSVVCAVPGLIWMPRKTVRDAKKTYQTNNDNRYYGEIVFENGELIKIGGCKRWVIPMSDTALYVEDTDFMAFASVGNIGNVVLLPARCMTEEMAGAVRAVVFADNSRIKRRVLHRMQAGTQTPIPLREPMPLPQTLWSLRFTYQPEELKTLLTDVGRQRVVRQLPVTVMGSIGAGLAMWLCFESLSALFITTPAMILLMTLVSSLNAAATAKRVSQTQTVQIQMHLTERGLDYEMQPSGRKVYVRWQGIERAVESDTAVELTLTGGELLRIPKRCIDDMETLRSVIDTHRV